MINNYQKQAEDFLTKAKATIKIELAKQQQAPLWVNKDGQDYGLMYNITIERENKNPWNFNFWDSIANKEKLEAFKELRKNGYQERWINKKYYSQIDIRKFVKEATAGEFTPSAYDVLACLTKYNPGDFEDFCADYGYDEDSRTAEKIFLAVIKEWNAVNNIFGDLMEELQEIN